MTAVPTRFSPTRLSDERIAALDDHTAFRTAEELLERRAPRDAVRILEHLRRVGYDDAGTWELLGRAHFAAAHLSAAETAFRRLVELEPTSAWAHTALARALERQSRFDEAAAPYRLATAMGATARQATEVDLVDDGTSPVAASG